ncbi:hypothetical protein SAMN05421768_1033 [Chryseobacterium joostei]|uniref:Uncharacterized protein n=1 Tax=Chryseobacterium joostei TaxID=112234 RepID=A0A1N7I6G7_9FLAO|nr:hypothetical protein SAMN05421768_1033 [Chryseobacterium joostei]
MFNPTLLKVLDFFVENFNVKVHYFTGIPF